MPVKISRCKVKRCLKSTIKNVTMNCQCQETHVKKASQIIPLRKNWPVPIHTRKKTEKNWSIKWSCCIAWRPTSAGSDGPRLKRQLWCEGPSAENSLLLSITLESLSSLVSQKLSAGKVKMSKEEAPRCHSKTTVLRDNQRRRLSVNTAIPSYQ